jgi:hypothetical protein
MVEEIDIIAYLKANPLPAPESYAEYLKSRKWKKIRNRILKRDRRTCQRCGGHGSSVHHRSYDDAVMDGLDDTRLVTVCGGCHNVITFDSQGRRRTLAEAEAVLADQHCPMDIPEPKVDLTTGVIMPTEWPRMTSVQRVAFIKRYLELRKEKRQKRSKNRPPKPEPPEIALPKPWS